MDAAYAATIKKNFPKVTLGDGKKNGNAQWNCNFCAKSISGTATRLLLHLTRPRSDKNHCDKFPDVERKKMNNSTLKQTATGKVPGGRITQRILNKARTSSTSTTPETFERLGKGDVDEKVELVFIANGMPFKIVE